MVLAMWFNVDYKKLAVLLLPTIIRKAKLVAFIQILLAPLVSLHYNWNQARRSALYKLAHNGQVCYLRKVLNDEYDPSSRRIEIVDGNKFRRAYIYTHAEQKPLYLGKINLRPSTDFEDTGVDFTILVPSDVIYDEYDLKALVDFYKLASKRYKIEEYE